MLSFHLEPCSAHSDSDKVDEMMDEMQEEKDIHDQISDAISRPIGDPFDDVRYVRVKVQKLSLSPLSSVCFFLCSIVDPVMLLVLICHSCIVCLPRFLVASFRPFFERTSCSKSSQS